MTVVVVVSDAETTRIAPCLGSLRRQQYRNLDIRVAAYGPAAAVLAAARAEAVSDWRIRVEPRIAADRAEACNQAAARCRGTYLIFVAGGDDVPHRGIARLVASLETSGAEMAVGRIDPPSTLHVFIESPYEVAHQADVQSTTLAQSPAAVTDLGIGNRLFRRTYWQSAQLRFSSTDAHGSGVALASYARASAFDLIPDAVYVPTGRREGVSVGATRPVLSELTDWVTLHEARRREIEALDLPEVMDWWLWGVLDAAIHPFLNDVERATAEQWTLLREQVDRLLHSAGDTAWDSLGADRRVKLWLLRHDRRPELEKFVTDRLFERDHRPTEVRDGIVLARLPFFEDERVGVPLDVYEMRAAETPLRVILHEVRWAAPELLELDLYVRAEHVGLTEIPIVNAWLVAQDSGARVEIAVRQYDDPRANLIEGDRYQDYSRGAVTVSVDPRELAQQARSAGLSAGGSIEWWLEVELSVDGLVRRGTVSSIDDRGSAGMIDTGHLAPRTVDNFRVGITGRSPDRLRFTARAAPTPTLAAVEIIGRVVSGSILTNGESLSTVVLAEPDGVVDRSRLAPAVDGLVTFTMELPRVRVNVPRPPRNLRVLTADGRDLAVGWPSGEEQWLGIGGEVVASRSLGGEVELVGARDTLILETIDLRDGEVEVRGRWLGTPPTAPYELRMAGPRVSAPGVVEESDGLLVARFSTTWDEWGLGEVPIPTNRYWFRLEVGPTDRARPGRVLHSAGLLDRLLDTSLTDTFRFRPIRSGRSAGIHLTPPIPDADRGPYSQAALQEWCRTADLPMEPNAVYLQSYTGASATDSQLAIHHELRLRHPELRLYWGVADRSSVVPEGGVPVLMHSREWYRVMATAGQLCMNIDFDRWFAPRPEQRVLQTFHGYPAKSMGIRMWVAKGNTPRRVDLELARTSGTWDLILTPAPEMDAYYREEYRYDGPIQSSGYPRDDILVSDHAARVREETRARLGIGADQRVVLYAPTWRDDLATNWRKAELTEHLDLEDASRRLGPDYVLLMRGHRFHGRSDRGDGAAKLIDVTTYPEINDLILAADVAVLDYSSLRFDFALTGRPMIFLVPDLASYTGGIRGFLYDFTESAPGPLVDTADEVIALLRDLDALGEAYRGEQEKFHERYNYLQDGRSAERVVERFFG